jgi:glycosyltransferase involved in cell wall biosynthesis
VLRSKFLGFTLRHVARLRSGDRSGSVTIVTVNWNSLEFLAVLVHAVRRFSPPGTEIIVVDNYSTSDDSRAWLRRRRDIRSVLLPTNIGHGPALDLGFLAARTEFVVALDVDAFPISESWLATLLEPLRSGDNVSGVECERAYAHPCCMAIRRDRFLRANHTFQPKYGAPSVDTWDAGELISRREYPRVHLFPISDSIGPGFVGTTWAGLAYHNFYSTRHSFEFGNDDDGELDTFNIKRTDAARAWTTATQRHLGLSESDRAALLLETDA